MIWAGLGRSPRQTGIRGQAETERQVGTWFLHTDVALLALVQAGRTHGGGVKVRVEGRDRLKKKKKGV